jgi:hypothetical protein
MASIGWADLQTGRRHAGHARGEAPVERRHVPMWVLWTVIGVIAACILLLLFRAIRFGRFRIALHLPAAAGHSFTIASS